MFSRKVKRVVSMLLAVCMLLVSVQLPEKGSFVKAAGDSGSETTEGTTYLMNNDMEKKADGTGYNEPTWINVTESGSVLTAGVDDGNRYQQITTVSSSAANPYIAVTMPSETSSFVISADFALTQIESGLKKYSDCVLMTLYYNDDNTGSDDKNHSVRIQSDGKIYNNYANNGGYLNRQIGTPNKFVNCAVVFKATETGYIYSVYIDNTKVKDVTFDHAI